MATLTINGEQKTFDAPADMPLLWVLRDILVKIPAEPAAGKHPAEDADDVCEPWVCGSQHAAWQALFGTEK